MFWRREFWNRAAFWLVLGVGAFGVVPFLVGEAYTELRNNHLLNAESFCVHHAPPCVDHVQVTLRGPRYGRREIGSKWLAWRDGKSYDEFHVRRRYDDDLGRVRGGVRADVVGGDVIAVETPTGRVPVWGLGMPGAVRAMLLGLTFAGLGTSLTIWARRKALAAGSWWAPEAPSVNQGTVVGMVAMMPAAVGLFLCIVGVPWWPVWAGTWLVLTVVGVGSLVGLRGRSEGGEHKAED